MAHSWIKNPPQPPLIVYVQATYYSDMAQVYIPNTPVFRRPLIDPKMLRGDDALKLEDDADAKPKETSKERTRRRAKKRISDYVLSNDFEMFITFTFAYDRNDKSLKRQQLLDWLKNQRNRNGRFKYLAIQELHKDGEAIHFHALFKDYKGKISPAINPKTGRQLKQNGRAVFRLDSYTLGFTNVKLLGKEFTDRTKVAAYIKKYISKGLHAEKGQHLYLASKNLSLPVIEDNPQNWYEFVEPDWVKITPNGKIMRFKLGKSPLSDMFLESNRE